MIIAQIKSLTFHLERDTHTVRYAEVAKKAEFKEPNDRVVRNVVAESIDDAVCKLRRCVRERLQQFVEVRLNPEDFFMDVWYAPVENSTGAFWNNCCHSGGNHHVCPTPLTP